KKHAAVAGALAEHFSGLTAAATRRPEVAAAAAAIANLRGNPHAIAILRSGFGVGAHVRYLKATDELTDAAGVTGLSATVLGPPQSETFLAQVDPPASQHYLRLASDEAADITRIDPFPERWRLNAAELVAL